MAHSPPHRFHLPRLVWFALTIACIGIALRWYNLDYKVFGHDEVFTAIRATGHTPYRIVQTYANQFITAADLVQTQQLDPQLGWADTWRSLVDHPEHPPLYYLLTRVWMTWFGSSIAATRSLAVVFSLLGFPALYWLCRELFSVTHRTSVLTVEWVAIALFALSPFHVLFAQEARQYSLWTLATVAASAALIRAIRRQSMLDWGLYAVLLSLNYYASLLSAPMAIAHTLYAICLMVLLPIWHSHSEQTPIGHRRTIQVIQWRAVAAFSLANIVSLLLFSPWIWVILTRWSSLSANTAWMVMESSLERLWFFWRLHLSSVFVDILANPGPVYLLLVPTAIALLFLWGCIALIRRTPFQVWGLLLSIFITTYGGLIVSDFLMGAIRSKITRYFVPALAIEGVVVAFGLAVLMQGDRRWLRQLGRAAFLVLLTAGMASCGVVSQQSGWWNKPVSQLIPRNAIYLRQVNNPTVVTDLHTISLGNTIALSRLVPEETRFYIIDGEGLPPLQAPWERTVLFDPSSALRERVMATYPVEIVPVEGRLNRLVPLSDGAGEVGDRSAVFRQAP